jgi:hypothetical protein
MSKAYDMEEWRFEKKDVMSKLGFTTRRIQLIMKCINCVSYYVIISGEPEGHISLL